MDQDLGLWHHETQTKRHPETSPKRWCLSRQVPGLWDFQKLQVSVKAVILPVLSYIVVVIKHSGTDGTILLRFNLAGNSSFGWGEGWFCGIVSWLSKDLSSNHKDHGELGLRLWLSVQMIDEMDDWMTRMPFQACTPRILPFPLSLNCASLGCPTLMADAPRCRRRWHPLLDPTGNAETWTRWTCEHPVNLSTMHHYALSMNRNSILFAKVWLCGGSTRRSLKGVFRIAHNISEAFCCGNRYDESLAFGKTLEPMRIYVSHLCPHSRNWPSPFFHGAQELVCTQKFLRECLPMPTGPNPKLKQRQCRRISSLKAPLQVSASNCWKHFLECPSN